MKITQPTEIIPQMRLTLDSLPIKSMYNTAEAKSSYGAPAVTLLGGEATTGEHLFPGFLASVNRFESGNMTCRSYLHQRIVRIHPG